MKTATVFQSGRFIKAVTLEGEDVSSEIDRDLRRVALQSKKTLVYDPATDKWAIQSTPGAPKLEDSVMNLVATETQTVIDTINSSISLKPKELIISDLKWKYLVRSAIRGKNIMMVGSAGSGKTMTAKFLSDSLKRPSFYFNLGATQDPRSVLIGNTHFSKDQGTFFSESLFVQAIQTENSVILLDELSRAHPEAWNILMTVLDLEQRYLRLDEKDGTPTIKVAPGVCFIATANIGSEYTATRVLDRALLDRFTVIEMEQLSQSDECQLLAMKFPMVDVNVLTQISCIAADIRSEYQSDTSKLSTSLSTRACVEVASLIQDGFTLSEASEVSIYPYFTNDGGIDSERTFVRQLVQKYDEPEESVEDILNVSDMVINPY